MINRPSTPKTYPGLENDINGGMTMIGKVIRDAWVFGILPETETCVDWEMSRIHAVHQQVNDNWDKYGCMVSALPAALAERHKLIYDRAIAEAKTRGWDPENVPDDDD